MATWSKKLLKYKNIGENRFLATKNLKNEIIAIRATYSESGAQDASNDIQLDYQSSLL